MFLAYSDPFEKYRALLFELLGMWESYGYPQKRHARSGSAFPRHNLFGTGIFKMVFHCFRDCFHMPFIPMDGLGFKAQLRPFSGSRLRRPITPNLTSSWDTLKPLRTKKICVRSPPATFQVCQKPCRRPVDSGAGRKSHSESRSQMFFVILAGPKKHVLNLVLIMGACVPPDEVRGEL